MTLPGTGLRRRAAAAAALFIILLAVGAGWWWLLHRGEAPHYVTQPVTSGDIERSVTMTGTVEPVQTVQVGSYVSGIVKQVSCDFNSAVTVGQVCARIDPAPFQLVVEQNKADITTSEAQLRKDRSALAYAKLNFERDSKLLADGVVSADTVDSDRNVLAQAEAQIGLDEATLVEKKAVLHAAEVNLAYTDIVSPVTGTVITRNVDIGQTVVSNLQSATLFLIAKDLTHMQVETNVAEADIAAVKVGQTARFSVQAYQDRNFEGVVKQIRQAPVTVQSVVTYDVVVAVENPDKTLLPGMTADTHIIIAERNDVLRVPLQATRFAPAGAIATSMARRRPEGERPNGERPRGDRAARFGGERPNGGARPPGGRPNGRVWVLRDGALTAIPVRIGLDDGTLVEVSGQGLQVGDQVVVAQSESEARHAGGLPQQPQRRGFGLGFRP